MKYSVCRAFTNGLDVSISLNDGEVNEIVSSRYHELIKKELFDAIVFYLVGNDEMKYHSHHARLDADEVYQKMTNRKSLLGDLDKIMETLLTKIFTKIGEPFQLGYEERRQIMLAEFQEYLNIIKK